ncbi:sigma-70 family RNA polymerase sigma factor [Lachnospiraceae bacterium 10-1]|jgi:RNA polymerase sigma factor (sigma-70 family)|nr:sigma-70 family RNA polymerase sigma factor [Lachnospiraceae bacterium MD335]EOS73116.1 sigma-70 family RNA polymerase sigma factor [Lachnospiraceae bacterium 10-1]NDO51880.1 sigma-70 family RNA polymerase sigma factor [Lachnospiraceae bacterium MD335]
MSEKIIRIKSGNEEITMNVTEEEYRNYFRPWWQMKKREQRNREAMEQNGYTEESYEEWKENDMRTELFAESMEELAEKRMLLGVLQDAMDSLLPEERELAMKVFGEEMQVSEFAKSKNESRTTVSSRKQRVMEKLRLFFEDRGFDVHK